MICVIGQFWVAFCLWYQTSPRCTSFHAWLNTSISRQLTLTDQFLTPDWKIWAITALTDTRVVSKNMKTPTNARKHSPINNAISCVWILQIVRVRTHCGTGYEIFVNVRKSSNHLRKSSDVFGNVRKSSEHLRKSRYSEDKNLTHLTHEKLAGILIIGN